MIRFIFVFIVLLSGCHFFCSLNDNQRLILKEANERFNHYCDIEIIPCESYYVKIILKTKEDPNMTSQLHKILYDKEGKKGWLSLHIYDAEGQFLLTHNNNGKRSEIAPNW